MARRRGRPRKSGPREPSGKLARTFDKGTDRAQAMTERFGQDGCDAIGRAYRIGLLGEGQDAKAMLDTARGLASAYQQFYGVGGITSPIADKQTGSREGDQDRAQKRREWLDACLREVKRYRPAFDQLCLHSNPDSGPEWLERIIAGTPKRDDGFKLDIVLEALAMLAGVSAPVHAS